jgi:hypothetical protein
MPQYYIRYDCPECGQLHGVFDYITDPQSNLSGRRLSDVYSPMQLSRFRGETIQCSEQKLIELDLERLVLASELKLQST